MTSVLGEPDRALSLWEAGGESTRKRSEQDEYDDELDRLVDRVLQEPLLEHGGLEVRSSLLERRDKQVGAAAGHAAEEDRRDGRGDQRRGDSADRARDDDVGHAEVTLSEQLQCQRSESHHHPDADGPSQDDEERLDLARVAEEREALRVIWQDSAEDEPAEHSNCDRQAHHEPAR